MTLPIETMLREANYLADRGGPIAKDFPYHIQALAAEIERLENGTELEELSRKIFEHGWNSVVSYRSVRPHPLPNGVCRGWLAHLYRRFDRDKPLNRWGDGWIYGEGKTAIEALRAACETLNSVEPFAKAEVTT